MLRRIFAVFAMCLLAIGMFAPSASAKEKDPNPDPTPVDQQCAPLDSGKKDTTGDPMSVTITAPEGKIITGYCVKAGSANQGEGPQYPALTPEQLNQNSITITYPSKEKAISHYSFSYTDAVVPDPVLIELPQPQAPTPVDVCGTENDTIELPKNGDNFIYARKGNTVFVVANPGYKFAEDVTTVWVFAFTDEPCPELPELIGVQPTEPTFKDVCGTDNDITTIPPATEKYSYVKTQDGMTVTVTAVPVGNRIFAQDVKTEWKRTFTDVPCDAAPPVETPPVDDKEPEAPVVPPVDEEKPEVPVVDEPKAPVDFCDNLKEVQSAVPAGMVKNDAGHCVLPASAITPVTSDRPGKNRGYNVQTAASSLTTEAVAVLPGVAFTVLLVSAVVLRRRATIS